MDLEFESEAPTPGASDTLYSDASRALFQRIADRVRRVRVRDDFNPDLHPRGDHGQWTSGGAPMKSWSPPQSTVEWANVEGQNHEIDEPPLPNLTFYRINSKGEKVEAGKQRLSSGVIMREKDGRTWVIKPTNGYGGYNYTFPKGGVEEGLHPQANAIKETYEETGLKARITGYAGDYHGDSGVTRMYHAERVGGHPKDKGWETERVALAHPFELPGMLNRSRDKKIMMHHILSDEFNPNELRDPHGKWTTGGANLVTLVQKLEQAGVPHWHHDDSEIELLEIPSDHEDVLQMHAKKLGLELQKEDADTIGEQDPDDPHSIFSLKSAAPSSGGTTIAESWTKADETKEHFTEQLKAAGIPHTEEPGNIIHVGEEHENKAGSIAAKHGDAIHSLTVTGGTKFGIKPNDEPADTGSGFVPSSSSDGGIDMDLMSKIGGKMGSNEGGTYESPVDSTKYYIKKPPTPDHVTNELLAAKLYQLAGSNTMNYVPVKGGAHVATVLQKLDKNNVSKFDAGQRESAKNDFAVHAWLANWDAVGTGGDNQVVVEGTHWPTTVDTGGSLKYRAQGTPKGAEFGNTVNEINTLRDFSKSPDAAALFGDMTNDQIKASIGRVTNLSTQSISDVVYQTNLSLQDKAVMLDKLIARKNDLAEQAAKMGLTAQAAQTKTFGQATPPAVTTAKTPHDYVMHVKGTSAERVAWRKELTSAPSLAAKKELQNKIVASFFKQYSKTPGPKKEDLKNKLNQYAKKYGVLNPLTKAKPVPSAVAAPAPVVTKHDVSTPIGNFKQSLDEHGVKYTDVSSGLLHHVAVSGSDADKVKEIAKWHPQVLVSGDATLYSVPKAATTISPATAAELEKAKKNVKLQLQYVPGAPTGHPEAQKLVDKFNEQYEGKNLSESELHGKVTDFKKLQSDMIPLMSEQQKAEAAQQATVNAQAAAKAAAAKAKLLAEENDPEVKKHMAVLAGIGLDKSDWTKQSFIDKHNLAITPQDGAYITAYRSNHYTKVNEQLRDGTMTIEQAKYASALHDALSKMPKHVGYTQRGIQNDTGGKIYKAYASKLGKVSIETQFNSAGKKHKLWGATTLHIEGKTGRDISSFNPNEGGGEIVYLPGTKFHVTKANDATREIWMEEI